MNCSISSECYNIVLLPQLGHDTKPMWFSTDYRFHNGSHSWWPFWCISILTTCLHIIYKCIWTNNNLQQLSSSVICSLHSTECSMHFNKSRQLQRFPCHRWNPHMEQSSCWTVFTRHYAGQLWK